MDPYDFFRIKIIWLGSLECGDATHIKTKPKGPLHQSGKPVLTLTLIASFRRHHQRQCQGNLIDYPYCTAFLVTAVSHSFICSFLGWIEVLTADPKTLLFPSSSQDRRQRSVCSILSSVQHALPVLLCRVALRRRPDAVAALALRQAFTTAPQVAFTRSREAIVSSVRPGQ
jgi:hypothetical protein